MRHHRNRNHHKMLEPYKHCKHQVGSTSISGGISHLSMHVMAILNEALFDAARFSICRSFLGNEYASMPSTFKNFMCMKHLWIKHTNRSGKFDSAKLLIKRWQSKPSGFNINAQLIFPARNVTGLMCCSVTWCQVIHRKNQVKHFV